MWQRTKRAVGQVLSHPVTVNTTAALFLAAAIDGASSAVVNKPYYGGQMLGVVGLGQNYNHVAGAVDFTASHAINFVVSAFDR